MPFTPKGDNRTFRETVALAVVMPVFNEESSLEGVLREWFPVLHQVTASHFLFFALDDGSTDSSPQILKALQREWGNQLRLFRHKNIGHGQTCLEGYRAALASNAKWILQIDSDGQCDPSFFPPLWARRDDFDVLYGVRSTREDGLQRVLVSWVLKVSLRILFGISCEDPNVPYRLMSRAVLERFVDRIPPDFVLANVALAALLARERSISHGTLPIHFRNRSGGKPAVPLGGFATRAVELFMQLSRLLSRVPVHTI